MKSLEVVRKVLAEGVKRDPSLEFARKVLNSGKPVTFHHKNRQKSRIHVKMAHRILSKFSKLKTPKEKKNMVQSILHSPKHMHATLNGVKLMDEK